MSLNVSDLALARETVGFIAAESAYGGLAAFVAANAIGVLGMPEVTQDESFTDSEEAQDSLSQPPRFRDKTPAGSWNFDIYSRPAGAAGSAPAESVLLEAALGLKTVNTGVSVVYSPAKTLPSFSLGVKIGHGVAFASGCVVTELALSITNKGAVKWTAKGNCARVMRAGTALTTTGSTTTLIALATGGAKLFNVGARVEIGGEDNSGSGYAITAVDTSADTITVTPALGTAPSSGETVLGFLPTASLIGDPLEGRLAQAKFDSAVLYATQASLTISKELKMVDDVLSDVDYPEGAIPGRRTIEGSLDLYYLREYLSHFTLAKNQTDVDVIILAGNTAGRILTINLPQAQLNTPKLAGNLEVSINTPFRGQPSAALEDEITVIYT